MHNGGLYNLYASLYTIRLIKAVIMIWVGQLARMGSWEIWTLLQSEKLRGRDHMVDLFIDGVIILIFKNNCEMVEYFQQAMYSVYDELLWTQQENIGFYKRQGVFDYLSNYKIYFEEEARGCYYYYHHHHHLRILSPTLLLLQCTSLLRLPLHNQDAMGSKFGLEPGYLQ